MQPIQSSELLSNKFIKGGAIHTATRQIDLMRTQKGVVLARKPTEKVQFESSKEEQGGV